MIFYVYCYRMPISFIIIVMNIVTIVLFTKFVLILIILITYSCQWVGWHKECRGKLEQSRSSQHLAQPS